MFSENTLVLYQLYRSKFCEMAIGDRSRVAQVFN